MSLLRVRKRYSWASNMKLISFKCFLLLSMLLLPIRSQVNSNKFVIGCPWRRKRPLQTNKKCSSVQRCIVGGHGTDDRAQLGSRDFISKIKLFSGKRHT